MSIMWECSGSYSRVWRQNKQEPGCQNYPDVGMIRRDSPHNCIPATSYKLNQVHYF